MPFKKKNQTQITVLSVILALIMLFYAAHIYSIQVVNAAKYVDKNDGATSVRTAVLKAPRGEILDCYGRQIAVNRDGYNVVFNKAYVKDNLNDVILTVVNLFEEKNVEWKDELPMNTEAPYGFKESESTDKLISKLELAHYATTQNCFDAMVKKYKLENYTTDEQRSIMGVRYSMDIADFSISYPYTFAEDIPTELMRQISESGFLLSGVSVEVVPFREYTDTSLAVNLIGTVGPIFAEDWDEYKKKGYSYNDKVGKSGIEKWGEDYLRGKDGEITYRIDTDGNIISSEITKEPVAGKTIMLTLDKKLQRSTQDSIERTVKEQQGKGGTARAGAAVAININSGKILCAANYPTYDSATIGKNYDSLVNDPAKPLTDRAFQGVYPIGSTIKPAVAVAALQNNLYKIGETVNCVMTYDYFDDFKPKCMHDHGPIDLNNALAKSC
ncbi:MAG: penicillin-binding transpeptidase domain-containing protein, partial [Acutalibacteraceae bacterium]|nr:penicillin-binding transpeptidase domain-containing protein [Acutalibacteraceae bacterium]